jgi:hypothetical protein
MATRRKAIRKPASKLTRAQLRLSYRKRALKGWATRRYHANPVKELKKTLIRFMQMGGTPQDVNEMLEASREGIVKYIDESNEGIVKTFAQARFLALGADSLLDGKQVNDWDVLKSMVSNEDERWMAYIEMCEIAGFDLDESRDYWFSPEM